MRHSVCVLTMFLNFAIHQITGGNVDQSETTADSIVLSDSNEPINGDQSLCPVDKAAHKDAGGEARLNGYHDGLSVLTGPSESVVDLLEYTDVIRIEPSSEVADEFDIEAMRSRGIHDYLVGGYHQFQLPQ